jgi:hypothetical protein
LIYLAPYVGEVEITNTEFDNVHFKHGLINNDAQVLRDDRLLITPYQPRHSIRREQWFDALLPSERTTTFTNKYKINFENNIFKNYRPRLKLVEPSYGEYKAMDRSKDRFNNFYNTREFIKEDKYNRNPAKTWGIEGAVLKLRGYMGTILVKDNKFSEIEFRTAIQ